MLFFEYLIDIELTPNIKWESSPDMFKYNKTEPFLLKLISRILNIGFSKNFLSEKLAKINLAQAGKYFVYEHEEIMSFSRLSGKTTENYFHMNSPWR